MKKFLLAFLLFLATVVPALAQPGPTPSPFYQNGAAISPLDNSSCFTFPSNVTGGCMGNGTANFGSVFVSGSPIQGSNLPFAQIWIGNNLGVAAPHQMSGDCTLSSTGVITCSAASGIVAGTTGITNGHNNGLAYQDASGKFNVTTSLANAVAVTGGDSVPQWATTLPDGLAIGTPSSGNLANVTGLPVSTGISGFGAGVATSLGVNVGSAGAPILFDGAGGTPSSLTLSNATGLPVSTGISGLGARVAAALAVGTNDSGGLLTNGGTMVYPTKPDTVEGYYTLTTTASSTSITAVAQIGTGAANFTVGDVGKLIKIPGAGPTEGYLTTTIATVVDASHITVGSAPTQSMSAVSTRIVYGSDQTTNLQAAFDAGKNGNVGVYVPAGTYLTTSTLNCMPPAQSNGANAPGPMCNLDSGAIIMAMAPMTAVLQYGSAAVDFSGIIRQATFGGGTLDGNFLADYGADIPFATVATRANQITKNTKLAGVRWGRVGAPSPTGGTLDLNVGSLRDIYYVPVSAVTNGVTPTVTTAYDHGYSSGRVVTFTSMTFSGGTPPSNAYYQIDVTGPTTFTLRNTNSTGWGTFVSGNVALTMPSMRQPHAIWGITNANPGVVTTADNHNFANSTLIWMADMTGPVNLGGVYCAKNVTATTFDLYQSDCTTTVNTTSSGTFGGSGTVNQWDDPTTGAQKGIYYENATDTDVIGAQLSGNRYQVYADTATSGWGGKYEKIHCYNYNEAGEAFACMSLGGENTVVSLQCDPPQRYCAQFDGPRNSLIGARLNYFGGVSIGPLIINNNYASFVRLDGSGGISVFGGVAAGQTTDSVNVLTTVSQNNYQYAGVSSFFQSGLKANQVSVVQPDTLDATTFFKTNPFVADGVTIYTPFNGSTNTSTTRAGIQFDGTNQGIGFYTANTFRGAFNSAGTLALVGGASFGGNVTMSNGQYIYSSGGTGTVSAGILFGGASNLLQLSSADAAVANVEPALFQIASGAVFQLGNTYVGTPCANTGTVTIKDEAGTSLRVMICSP